MNMQLIYKINGIMRYFNFSQVFSKCVLVTYLIAILGTMLDAITAVFRSPCSCVSNR